MIFSKDPLVVLLKVNHLYSLPKDPFKTSFIEKSRNMTFLSHKTVKSHDFFENNGFDS